MSAPDYSLQLESGSTPDTAGYRLRSARERLELSLRDVASTLNLMVSHVRGMETNRCAHLTNDKHFLRHMHGYAELVGIDADELVEMYRSQSAATDATIAAQPVKRFKRLQQYDKKWYAVGALAVACVALGLWSLQQISLTNVMGSAAQSISHTLRKESAATPLPANDDRIEIQAVSQPDKPAADKKNSGENTLSATPAVSAVSEKAKAGKQPEASSSVQTLARTEQATSDELQRNKAESKTTGRAQYENALRAVGAKPLRKTLVELKNRDTTQAQDSG